MRLFEFLILTAESLVGVVEATGDSDDGRQPIIIDTDLFSDVDDVGALAIANVLHNCGLADLRGIVLNTPSHYGALAASALCTYYGNDVPIAAFRLINNDTFFDSFYYLYGEYASKLAYHWPRKLDSAFSTPTPVELYRTILSSAKDKSIHIISIGFLTNLADLLKSEADHISPLSGLELAAQKVSELIIMGGEYPSGWEYNFGGIDPESTAHVVHHWPKSVNITYSGSELGGNIFSGQSLVQRLPPDSPVLSAYQWYVGRGSTLRPSWDPITTLYGVLGLDLPSKIGVRPMLEYGNESGYNSIVLANGSNVWINDTDITNQHWLRLVDGANYSMAALLDEFLSHDPSLKSCFRYDLLSENAKDMPMFVGNRGIRGKTGHVE
ncbi:nucleoside hydrolase [Trichoderma longibrachiatum ATCC 18648]|uniref:Nucleoside hydrolase n=1 Tax=Trichoderma longibrachiatum ATCC 18648 TaxID=983965 RepID=A0A2T4BWI6_TRILO|nr:nucleoside hydrolase [Trichoderma longibrachiatum ATCC 18648]